MPVDKKVTNKKRATKIKVSKYSDEWNKLLADDLQEDEMIEGTPTYYGLKRLVEKFVSPITSMSCEIQPVFGDKFYCIAKARIELENGEVYEAAADAHNTNTKDNMRSYITSCADTRAKSRACKEALGLKNVVSAEQLGQDPDDARSIPASALQISYIENKAAELKIPVEAIIKEVTGQEKFSSALHHGEAVDILQRTQEWLKRQTELPTNLLEYTK